MKKDVFELAEGITLWEFSEAPELYPTDDKGSAVAEPVCFRGSLQKEGEKIVVRGKVSTQLELVCSRCLETFSLAVAEDFYEEYLPEIYEAVDREKPLHGDDMDVSYYSGTEIDLTPALRDRVLLAVPIAPVCRADCPGLCPVCGCNLKREPFHRHEREEDERLSPLRRLKL